MSLGLMAFSWFSLAVRSGSGKPSTTYSGLLLPAEVMPRTRTDVPRRPARRAAVRRHRHARRPALQGLGGIGHRLARQCPGADTDDTAPVTLPRCWVP